MPRRDLLTFLLASGGLLGGFALWLFWNSTSADLLWSLTIAVALVPLGLDVFRELRRGHTGVDLIALIAMVAALAFGEVLAGAVVAVMLSGGQLLEGGATRRANRELAELIQRTPSVVDRLEGDRWVRVSLDQVEIGDRLLVKGGGVLPVDGVLASQRAVVDESALTGEPLPRDLVRGQRLRSGIVNAGSAFEMQATAAAEESTYAGVVRLVEQAQASRAPMVRMADRFAGGFLVLTITMAALAALASGDWTRSVAVLVVATPCPLILAAPIAVLSGVSRAARRGVLIKGGSALEALALAQTLVLDKTGTVTSGVPTVAEILPQPGIDAKDLLRLAASLDIASPHVLAESIVEAARRQGLELTFPEATDERFGDGIEGTVEGRSVRLGRAVYVLEGVAEPESVETLGELAPSAGSVRVFVAIDGRFAGTIRLNDPLREDAADTLKSLRELGLAPIILATGDDHQMGEHVGQLLGVDRVGSELTPEAKLDLVREEATRDRVLMVGDGINDAPALAAADVGVAMGARGATAASEVADAVIMPDRLDRLVDAVVISRRSRSIALQSIWVGMVLSGLGMVAAAIGWLPAVAGALLQEAIDVAVILNALRAASGGSDRLETAG